MRYFDRSPLRKQITTPMKYLTVFILMLGVLVAYSQKQIILRDGEVVPVKKFYLNKKSPPGKLKFKDTNSDFQEFDRSEVFVIQKNKHFYAYNSSGVANYGKVYKGMPVFNPQEGCSQGAVSAIHNYSPYKTQALVTGISSFLVMPVGAVVAGVYNSKDLEPTTIPEARKDDNEFVDCYVKTHEKKRKMSNWLAWGTGWSYSLLLTSLIITASN